MHASWKDNSITRKLSQHSIGRKIMKTVGPRFIQKSVANFQMYLDLQDGWGVSKYILKHGNYDPELGQIMKKLLKPGARCIDIGANIGYWTNFLLSSCKAGKVYSIEPEPSNVDLFRANSLLNNNSTSVQLFACAVGEENAQLKLFLSADNAGDHQLYSQGNGDRKYVTVDVKRIDDLITDKNIDFVKIDVQGYEPYVFRGMKDVFAQNPNIIVLSEFWPTNIKKAGNDPTQMLNDFANDGFKFHLVKNSTLQEVGIAEIFKEIPEGHSVDLVFSRKKLD